MPARKITEAKPFLLPEGFLNLEENMDWWPDLPDLERLNVLAAHREDRARLLASDSKSVEATMKAISKATHFRYLDEFTTKQSYQITSVTFDSLFQLLAH